MEEPTFDYRAPTNIPKIYWEEAIQVQSACNLSGVVLAFARAISEISSEAFRLNHGTDWVRKHPISRMFAEQIFYLTEGTSYSTSYDICEEKIEEYQLKGGNENGVG
jgi:hypothetical protein